MSGTVTKVTKYCSFCRTDVTNTLYIRCASPKCIDFDTCLHCFSQGYAVYPHCPDHPYRVMDNISAPIFSTDWGADEEIALLQGIEKYGLGNWSEVAQHVGKKSEAQCEEHYFTIYLQSPVAPLPDLTAPLPYNGDGKVKVEVKEETARVWRSKQLHHEKDEDVVRWRTQQHEFKAQQKNSLATLVGYLPQRNDFEVEYMNDAEKDLAEMEFKETDTKLERELKHKVLVIYNNILDARAERKEFIERYQLLLKRDKRLTKEEKEVFKMMRPFARFLEPAEFDEFVRSLVCERVLRVRIEQLQSYRLNGVQTLADGAAFDIDYHRMQQQWMQRYHQEYVDIAQIPIGQTQVMTDALSYAYSANASQSSSSSSSNTTAKHVNKKQRTNNNTAVSAHSNTAPMAPQTLPNLQMNNASKCPCVSSQSGVCAFDISRMEGVQLLSRAEQMLCTELHLIPAHYMVIKERIIRESIAHGYITQGQARNVLKIDINCSDKILNFCVSAGLVNNLKPDA